MDPTNQRKFIDRKLGERSFLKFEFSQEGREVPAVLTMPFHENVNIVEGKKSNLVQHDPIGRASSILTYTGAKARTFKLTFHMTLPHLISQAINIDRYVKASFGVDTQTEKDKFFKVPIPTDEQVAGGPATVEREYIEAMVDHYGSTFVNSFISANQNFNGEEIVAHQLNLEGNGAVSQSPSQLSQNIDNIINFAFGLDNTPNTNLNTQGVKKTRHSVITVIVFWVNLIRSSIYNNSDSPILGPPLVRLNHGILYRDIPCTAQDYNIQVVPEAGIDVQTLLPRRLEVSMNLIETRAGDFTKFNPGVFVERDNLAGWEAVINTPHTLDPQPEGQIFLR